MDNIFIERLWRSLKYEAIYLFELTDGFVAERVIGEWIDFYNNERPHSAFDGKTPAEAYGALQPMDMMDKATLQRFFPIFGDFVSLPPSPSSRESAKAPGTVGFGGFHRLAVGSYEEEWWARQDFRPSNRYPLITNNLASHDTREV